MNTNISNNNNFKIPVREYRSVDKEQLITPHSVRNASLFI